MATIMDGRALAATMQEDLARRVVCLRETQNIIPGLAVILVGDDAASQVYVRNKERAANRVGFYSETTRLPSTTSQSELLAVIDSYNRNPAIHGILVQLPLPPHLNKAAVLEAVDPNKDVDGFHPINMGRLWSGHGTIFPCTPYGIIKLIESYNIDCVGKKALVVGRSSIVGKPIGHLLLEKDATVTIAHSKTKQLKTLTQQADILVVAIGQANFIGTEDIKESAVVIDVGMNRDEAGKLCGDVAREAAQKASYITPVPGGVGPMTITMLLEQTYYLAEQPSNTR